jgi:hypothetical protein
MRSHNWVKTCSQSNFPPDWFKAINASRPELVLSQGSQVVGNLRRMHGTLKWISWVTRVDRWISVNGIIKQNKMPSFVLPKDNLFDTINGRTLLYSANQTHLHCSFWHPRSLRLQNPTSMRLWVKIRYHLNVTECWLHPKSLNCTLSGINSSQSVHIRKESVGSRYPQCHVELVPLCAWSGCLAGVWLFGRYFLFLALKLHNLNQILGPDNIFFLLHLLLRTRIYIYTR